MMGRLRPLLRPVVTMLARPLAARGVNPNRLSLCAIPLALACGVLVVLNCWGLAFVFGLLSALVDLVDGTVARLQGRKTAYGNYLETMVDRIVEAILYAALSTAHPWAGAAALAAAMLVSYAKARVGLVIIADNHDWPSLGERAERLTLVLSGIFLAACGLRFAVPVALWLLAALAAVGTVQRMAYARRLIEAAERDGRLLPYLR